MEKSQSPRKSRYKGNVSVKIQIEKPFIVYKRGFYFAFYTAIFCLQLFTKGGAPFSVQIRL